MHLEGSYIPREILRRADPARTSLQFLDNTFSYLVPSDHDNTLIVRWVLRTQGSRWRAPIPRP